MDCVTELKLNSFDKSKCFFKAEQFSNNFKLSWEILTDNDHVIEHMGKNNSSSGFEFTS